MFIKVGVVVRVVVVVDTSFYTLNIYNFFNIFNFI